MMPWELEPPRTTLMLVVKGTFVLTDGALAAIADPQVPCTGPIPWEDGDNPSLKTETDYAVLKPRGEWYLTGHAYAPGGRPATVVAVKARVGALQKQLAVRGDQVWERGVLGAKPSEPVPFTAMPLRWERSFGGPKIAENPVGAGTTPVVVDKNTYEPLPNITDPARPIVSRDDRPPPAGMFPIPVGWRARSALTGTYDEIWKASRWPYFPKDFDFNFFHCAPPDQRLREGYWRGDEEIEVYGTFPDRPGVRTRLPGVRARVFIEWATPRPPDATPLELLSPAELAAMGPPKLVDVPLYLDTIVLDTDLGVATCQWRGRADVADMRLTNVARIYVIHEPLDTNIPHAEYERWFLHKLMQEAAEYEMSEPEDAIVPAGTGPAPLDPEIAKLVDEARAGFDAAMAALAAGQPKEAEPNLDEVREKYDQAGFDAAELLPEPEPVLPPESEEPRSLRRLGAIVRRMLGRHFRELDLSGAPYDKMNLSGVDFSGSVLTGAGLRGANLRTAIFDGATLARADLEECDARGASFRDADVSEVKASRARFDQAVFDDASGSHGTYTGASFAGASLAGADLEASDLRRCDFRGAKMDAADLVHSKIDESNFTGASMIHCSLESVHGHGAHFERCSMADLRASDGADFTRARFVLVDAPRAQFAGATLVDANLSGSNLEEAELSDIRAERANFVRSVLRKAKLDRADLRDSVLMAADFFEASFQEAELAGADGRGAHFFSANFWRAKTRGAHLDGAIIDRTFLSNR